MVYIDQWRHLDDFDKTLTRRDFLLASGLLLVSGKLVYDELIKYGERNTKSENRALIEKIYNEYPKYLHFSRTESKVTMDNNGTEEESLLKPIKGYGTVINDKYISVEHVVNRITPTMKDIAVNTEQVTILYDVPLTNIVMDYENDLAVFQIPEELEIKNRFSLDDICFDEPRLGEEMYLIGNPGLSGVNVRKCHVSDLDGISHRDKKGNTSYFGIDIAGFGGDSGTIIVNKKGKVTGIASRALYYIATYGVKMKSYQKYL